MTSAHLHNLNSFFISNKPTSRYNVNMEFFTHKGGGLSFYYSNNSSVGLIMKRIESIIKEEKLTKALDALKEKGTKAI